MQQQDPMRVVGEVEACLERLEDTAEAQRGTLLHGLQLTAAALPAAGQGPGSAPAADPSYAAQLTSGDAAAAVCRQRLRLLQHLERLDTAVALMNGTWSPAVFASLRDCTIAEAASALATAGRLAALPVLLALHPRALLPSILDVFSSVPETVDAKQLAPLLRQVASLRQPPPLPREPDWVESSAVAADLREAGQYAMLLATEPMCAVSQTGGASASSRACGGAAGWRPPTERQLAAWVCERAQQLDGSTGQLPNALALLEAGAAALHYGQPSIGALLALGQELLPLIKLAASRGGCSSAWRMGLRQYAGLPPAQRLSLMLGLLGSDNLADDLALHVAPFLARLESGGTSDGTSSSEAADPQVVLRKALEGESVTRLGWVVRLIQSEARQRSVFADAAQLTKTAGACCYACQATDAWELLNSMLSAARDALRADTSLGRDEEEVAAEGLAAVRGHVTAARLLTKHGLTTTASTVRDADRAAALRLLRTLLARVSRTKNTESRWVEVWMDVRSIQEHGFGQLSAEEVRVELCRALLRVGQYRLCAGYLKPLPAEAAEQLVLAAGKEVYLSASNMTDKAVKQAKECFSLLPASAAAREQLAGIAAAEQLQKLGLDLPPLQLQQLHAQAASGNTMALEQLLTEHPKLLAADSRTLDHLAAALGLEHQQQPLLLRAAAAAHAVGELQRAEGLLQRLVERQYRPAWQLAAAVSQDPRCSASSREGLLSFALASASADQLLPLLLQWQAMDSAPGASGSGCWALFSAADAAADQPEIWAEQQRWLARQLRLHLIALGRSSSGPRIGAAAASGSGAGGGAGTADEAAVLGCLLALGPRGLLVWEKLLSEQLPRPLGVQQRRQALLLGLKASALLALQSSDLEPAGVTEAAAAAQTRWQSSPVALLHALQQQQLQAAASGAAAVLQRPGGSGGSSTPPPSDAASDAGDASSSDVAGAATGTARAAATAAASAAAKSAAAAERFHSRLLAAADAEQLQRLLPGIDAAAALAGGRASRRLLVLQLAAAAGKPPEVVEGSAAARSVGWSRSQPASFSRQRQQDGSPAGSPRGMALQRPPSRKKLEALPAGGQAEGAAAQGSPRLASRRSGATDSQEMLHQALALAAKSGVAAWEVHLEFAGALVSYSQQQWGIPRAAAAQLFEASLSQLLSGPPQAAAGLLHVLLLRVWPRCSSRWPQHLGCCLQAMQLCSEALAGGPGAVNGTNSVWRAIADVCAACGAAVEQLLQAAGSLDAKLFVDPSVQLVAAAAVPALGASSSSSGGEQGAVPLAEAAALNEQLLANVTGSNVEQLAAVVDELRRRHTAALVSMDSAINDATLAAYPCSSSTVHLALFCRTVGAGSGREAEAAQLCQQCLTHVFPAHAAAAAAFAVAGAPCPLALPPSTPALSAASLPESQQLAILRAALYALASAEPSAQGASADSPPAPLVSQLQLRFALLSAFASLAACCPNSAQLRTARAAAEALQRVALDGSSSQTGSTALLGRCLQQLLTAACPAPGILEASAVLQALQRQPDKAPLTPDQPALASPEAAAAAQEAVACAAEAAVSAALEAMSRVAGQSRAAAGAGEEEPLSAGDAVQNLFALLRSLDHLPDAPGSASPGGAGGSSTDAAAAVAGAVDALRTLVWLRLQQHVAGYDGSGGAAAAEAHLQVLELLGSIGTSMWSGWAPPAAALLPADGSGGAAGEPARPGMLGSHQRALLFTRTAAVLAQEWPEAIQQCGLSAADFGGAEAAEAALLRLAAAADGPQHLRLLLRLLQDGLAGAFPAPTSAAMPGDADQPAAAAAADEPTPGHELTAAADGRPPRVVALHRVWAACLRMLLALGDLAGALAALEGHAAQRAQQQTPAQQAAPDAPAALLTEDEAAALLEAADATQGAAAAAALALLLPYRQLQHARWQQLLQVCGSSGGGGADMAAAVPGMDCLLLLLLQHQPAALAELAAGEPAQQQLFKQVMAAALQQQQAAGEAYCVPLGSGCALTLRMAVAAGAAAQLAEARQYTAAAWLAMHASGMPRLLRVLDSATRVLQQLLRSCAAGSPSEVAATAAARQLEAGAAPPGLALPHTAAALLRGLPERCAAALEHMIGDLQL